MRGLFWLLLTAALGFVFTIPYAHAQQPDTLRTTTIAPAGVQVGSRLGYSAAIDGPYAVVGAPSDDVGSRDSGVVKVFDSTNGALLFLLPNPNPADEDWFGASVAISGTRVIVGSGQDDTGADNSGSAYVYDLSSATPTLPVAVLNNPDPASGDFFGNSVAISGTRVVVAAARDDARITDGGSVYVYDLSIATPTVPIVTLNSPGPVTQGSVGSRFGNSVAISGARVVVGAFLDNAGAVWSGSAYVYDLNSATPTVPVVTLNNPSPAASELFGSSVAVSGTRVVVGARYDGTGSVYVYDVGSATPTIPVVTLTNPSPDGPDEFGWAVAISGMRVAVGANFDKTGAAYAGTAYIYELSNPTPTIPLLTLNNPNPGTNDGFGSSVAFSGSRVIVGAPNNTAAASTGSAYVYDLSGAAPKAPVQMRNDPGPSSGELYGWSVAISGTRMVVGSPYGDTGAADSGSAYVYDLSSATPTVPVVTLNNPSPGYGDIFGSSVAISSTRVVVSAPFDDLGDDRNGSVYVYDLGSATPTVPVATLHAPKPTWNDYFGGTLAISGKWVVVGAFNDNTGATYSGSAYVYDLSSATPTVPAVTLNNPSPAASDHFGSSVAIFGSKIVVGASFDAAGATDSGSAYVYDLSSATPTVPVVTLNNPAPAAGDLFGSSVAISGTRVVVGAFGADRGAGDAGIAYVYDLSGPVPVNPVATLENPRPEALDEFGYSVAISDTRVVVGAYLADTGATDSGSAYVYDLSSATPTVPVVTLNNPALAAYDRFGLSVAIDGFTVAIGAPNRDGLMLDKGAVNVFAPANPDFDGDGLLDLWEHARFGSITAHTALDDTDSDGRNELLELAFNTDPLISDPGATPAVATESGFLTITLNKRAGVSYMVESAGSPDDAAFSMAATTILLNNASTLKVRDNFNTATASQRFLRVRVNAAP